MENLKNRINNVFQKHIKALDMKYEDENIINLFVIEKLKKANIDIVKNLSHINVGGVAYNSHINFKSENYNSLQSFIASSVYEIGEMQLMESVEENELFFEKISQVFIDIFKKELEATVGFYNKKNYELVLQQTKFFHFIFERVKDEEFNDLLVESFKDINESPILFLCSETLNLHVNSRMYKYIENNMFDILEYNTWSKLNGDFFKFKNNKFFENLEYIASKELTNIKDTKNEKHAEQINRLNFKKISFFCDRLKNAITFSSNFFEYFKLKNKTDKNILKERTEKLDWVTLIVNDILSKSEKIFNKYLLPINKFDFDNYSNLFKIKIKDDSYKLKFHEMTNLYLGINSLVFESYLSIIFGKNKSFENEKVMIKINTDIKDKNIEIIFKNNDIELNNKILQDVIAIVVSDFKNLDKKDIRFFQFHKKFNYLEKINNNSVCLNTYLKNYLREMTLENLTKNNDKIVIKKKI